MERGHGGARRDLATRLHERADRVRLRWGWLVLDESGQGTTEYAILVGVLVVIAVLAIITFRGKVQELWDAIATGIGQL